MPKPTACILCSLNCGLQVETEGSSITRIQGDPDHPFSAGYVCQKALRLDHYQNNVDRLTAPLRRKADGSFEEVSWDVAIREVAARLVEIRDTHGGGALAYYGGGGQGNHLGGIYGGALRAAMGTEYYYNALAQEKTGDFWVNGRLFGRQTCHVAEDIEDAELVLFLGTNPWQSHGIPRARALLKEIAADPERHMVVVDPRRTKTAALADQHLQVRPGTDAFLLAALLATLVTEGLVDQAFLEAHCVGYDAVAAALRDVPVDGYCRRAGIEPEVVRQLARRIAATDKVVVRVDLGLQHSRHSSLNSYLEKLLFLLTGHFGRPGTNTLHSFLLPLIGHSPEADDPKAVKAAVTGMHAISKFLPPNILPAEVLGDHPGRLRALVVDSANPMATGADTAAYRRAFEALDLVVVIDVALSETARQADYVLPASTQLEKWEATFFSLHFPRNGFHLRPPALPPTPGTLPEPEIYRRLLVAMGELPGSFPLLAAVARLDRRLPRLRLFPLALRAALAARPAWRPYAAVVLMETLGQALPAGAKAAAPLWAACHRYVARHAEAVRRAGVEDRGAGLAEALFDEIMTRPSGVVMSEHLFEDTWKMVRHADGKVHLEIPELLGDLAALADELEAPAQDPEFPFNLAAGERRSFNAVSVMRSPAWRRSDVEGALRLHPEDAERLGLAEGARARVTTRAGSVEVPVTLDPGLLPGCASLPHGYGFDYQDEAAGPPGPRINELTSAEHCDPWTRTPLHKTVPARVEALG